MENIHITEVTLSATLLISSLIICAASAKHILRLKSGDINPKGHSLENKTVDPSKNNLISTLIEAAPFGVSGFFYLIYFQFSIVIIKILSTAEQAGNYSVAFTLVSATTLLPGVIYQKFLLPKMHRWAYHDTDLLERVYRTGNVIMIALGGAVALTLYLSAPYAIPWIFGEKYNQSTEILQTLVFFIPIFYLASNAGTPLVTNKNMIKKIRYMGATAIISSLLNVVLIPEFGAIGAAISLIASYFFLAALYIRANKLYVFPKATPNS